MQVRLGQRDRLGSNGHVLQLIVRKRRQDFLNVSGRVEDLTQKNLGYQNDESAGADLFKKPFRVVGELIIENASENGVVHEYAKLATELFRLISHGSLSRTYRWKE